MAACDVIGYSSSMAITLRKTVVARELPGEWQREGRFAPEEQVTVTIELTSGITSRAPLRRFLGAGHGLFASAHAIDAHLDRQRDEWAP